MIAEILLSLMFLPVFIWQVARLSPKLRVLLWVALFAHIALMVFAHDWAVRQDPTGVVFDSSVDAQKYFDTAKDLSAYSLFSIEPNDISAISGGTWHLGYYYLVIFCMQLSANPMLLLRLIKVFVFMLALATAARGWQSSYGVRCAMWGALYLSFGWWEIMYYNFRNLRDGLIASICLLTFVLCERVVFSASPPAGPRVPDRREAAVRYGLIFLCLGVLASLRVYLSVIIIAGLAVHLVIASRMPKGRKLAFLICSVLVGLSPVLPKLGHLLDYGSQVFGQKIASHSVLDVGFESLKTMLSPVPWQYTVEFLIPSQCIYLLMLTFSLFSVVFLIRPKPWGQIFIVVMLTLFLGLVMESSYARKRLPIVPIFVSWMVAGLSARRSRRVVARPPAGWPAALENDVRAGLTGNPERMPGLEFSHREEAL